ncbi:glycosyltransferase family 4 protein [Halorussus rarus]|uniref:glycosyltransferase family 4 protein n=1 Tax=Halorussus TaxID=1070314 RepID=UPI0013B4476C|nr:glycosyltransferase family 4 protein [Halorussus rarus]NHN58582.1 glycosyltransferase family 4 protein [Halorussus sp. JP-T4]
MDIRYLALHTPESVGYDSCEEFLEFAEYHHEYCRLMDERGHDVEFWHLGRSERSVRHEYGHLVRQFPAINPGEFGKELSPSLYVATVRASPDVVHVHGFHQLNNVPLLVSQWFTDSLVVQNHGPSRDASEFGTALWYRGLRAAFAGTDATVLSVNRKEVRNVRRFSIGSDVEYIPNAVDTEKYRPRDKSEARERLGLGDGRYVLFVGRMEEPKGVSYLVDAMADVPATLLLVYGGGDDDHVAELRRRATDWGTNVEFVGRVSDDELVDYYNAADVCAFPSLTEGFGVVCLEAMACETPVVGTTAHTSGEQGHLDHGETALVAERADASSLRDEIRRLLDDDELRNAIATAGRESVVDEFSWPAIADQLEATYRRGAV